MPDGELSLPQFNLETMAGVFPGTRTQVFHRLRARPISGERVGWYLMLWFTDPAEAILFGQISESARQTGAPALVLDATAGAGFHERLIAAAAAAGLEVQTCGGCSWWQRTAWSAPDGLAVGACRWPAGLAARPEVASQGSLALSCPYWSRRSAAQEGSEQGHGHVAKPSPLSPLVKSAELDEDRLPRAQRWLRRLQRIIGSSNPTHPDAAGIMERSGVGAGTEPCLVCHGRIANLGALTVASPDGDKETLSVWRCRNCYTTYLNDWIDRWERLDSLETEETYYRIAPAEAQEILAIIAGIPGADHPGGRAQRHHYREQVLEFVRGRTPLSRQIKQGR